MSPKQLECLLYVHTVAKILACGNQHVYNLIQNGDLDGVRIGERALRVTKESVSRFVAKRKTNLEKNEG